MSEKQELIVFTGNVGSGKSLMASKLAKRGYVIINNDAITTMVHGGEYGMYNPSMKRVYSEVEMGVIGVAFQEGFSVVVDRTCMKVSDRERYIDIGKTFGANIHSFDWGPGNEKTLNRRLANPNGIPGKQWENVHKRMAASYESPCLEEGFHSRESGPKDYFFYAFDFDGTIVKNKFPDIGKEISETTEKIRELWENVRNIIIIWTCRSGDYLNEMKAFLIKEKIPFDFINENPLVDYGSPKIFAHEYYDDRSGELP